MDLREEQTSGRDNASEAPRRSRRLFARASLVIILMGIGAAVAVLVSAAMTVRYDTSATVNLPGRLDGAALLSETGQTSFVGPEGQELDVVALANSVRFVGSAEDPEVAARTANAAATAFVEGVADADVVLAEPASAPSDPASPRRLQNALIGLGAGALLGLVMQTGLRPTRVDDDGVEYVPSWTSVDGSEDPSTEVASSGAGAGPAGGLRRGSDAVGSSRPRPRSFQDAAGQADAPPRDGAASAVRAPADDLAREPSWANERPAPITIPGAVTEVAMSENIDDAAPQDDITNDDMTNDGIPEDDIADDDITDITNDDVTNDDVTSDDAPLVTAAEDHDPDAAVADEGAPGESVVAEIAAGDESADGESGKAPRTDVADADLASLDVPDAPAGASRGFRDLVDRTSANLDPLIDRFAAEDEHFDEDLDSLRASGPDAGAPDPANDPATEDTELVAQIAFLGDEVTNYQRRMDDDRERHLQERAELISEHESALESSRSELDRANAEIEQLLGRRDQVRSRLEDRVSEVEAALAATNDQLERARRNATTEAGQSAATNEDLLTEIEFMRSEVARYQRTLDDERVVHTTAIAEARLENQDELDRIHREHRETLNDLAQTNRNFLTAQRNEAEALIAELESDHQVALDAAHRNYEQRLNEARTRYSTQLAKLEQRTRTELQNHRTDEVAELQERLASALDDVRTSNRHAAELEAKVVEAARRVKQTEMASAQAERRAAEEQRQVERRSAELAELVNRTEERLAAERQRTNDVVRNLLSESASAASAAESARRGDSELRAEAEAAQRKELEDLRAQLRALEDITAQREAALEATIADLRQERRASPNG